MLDKTCNIFIDELASSSHVPGGGSASSLVGALGMALGSMVGELTKNKKGYDDVETEISELLLKSKQLISEFKSLVQIDMDAFSQLTMAYKLPKATEKEINERKIAIQSGLKVAAEAPIMIAEACTKALNLLDKYSIIGNKNLITDAGTGTVLCLAALKGARLNALINIKGIKDEELRDSLYEKINSITCAGENIATITYNRVEKACL